MAVGGGWSPTIDAYAGGGGLERVLAAGAVRAVFQPLVELDSGVVVGYEALARGPAGSRWESPAALFGAAYRENLVPDLDWACRAAALTSALAGGLAPGLTLFVNAEPASIGTPCPDHLLAAVRAGQQSLRVVVEVTERAVAADPAGLLRAVAAARDTGCGIALDDIGADPASLAMMPFIAPDVLKLDLRLVQEQTTVDVARIVNAVLAEAERSGAAVLAEGIETPQHVQIARAMGASLGQGWLYGRPGPLPESTAAPAPPLRLRSRPRSAATTPYQVVAARRATNLARKSLLLPMSMHLEHTALDATEPTVLLACFQEERFFTPASRRRFGRLARTAAFTAAVGVGMPAEPVPGVYGAELAADDPLRGEWDVIVVGPHFAGALVARDHGDTGADADREFDFAITHDRDLVIEAAQTVLDILVPSAAATRPAGTATTAARGAPGLESARPPLPLG
jgi:EAL domain-containing protein (putative c-di-GMP-specific phosphodiesterase class I)/DICT domain-containing protein